MADKTLLLDIVTPDRMLFSGEVNMIIAPAALGEVGILPLHAALLTDLNVGELRYKYTDGGKEAEEYIAIDGGFMEVFEDKVTVITPGAEFAREIDIERATAAQAEAKEALKKAENIDFEKAKVALLCAECRLRIVKRVSQ